MPETGGAAFIKQIAGKPGNKMIVNLPRNGIPKLTETGVDMSFPDPQADRGITSDLVSLTRWSQAEQESSSCFRELKTIEFALRAMRQQVAGKSVFWYTDNKGITSVVRKGSMKNDLNNLAANILDFCEKNDIELALKWVRRTENEVADRLSRFMDLDSWAISPELFSSISKIWGPFSVDRFASSENTKLPRFNSRFCCPGAEGVDAFLQVWQDENNWLVPPPALVGRVVRYLIDQKARGALVVPAWRSNKFWPFLFGPMGPQWFVKDHFLIPNAAKYLVKGDHEDSIFSPNKFKGAFIALRLNAA